MTTMLPAPHRTLEQRDAALKLANETRNHRHYLRTRLAQMPRQGAKHEIGGLIVCPPPFILTMKVVQLLTAVDWWGPARAGQLLRQCDIALSKTVAGLSPRQRDALRERLEERG